MFAAVVMGIGLIVFIGLLVVGVNTPPSKTESNSKVDFAEVEKNVKELMKVGLVKKVNPALNEAFVDRLLWNSTTYDQKKTVGFMLAHYCGHKKGTGIYWVDIRDNNSGKKLAEWSKAWGLKVTE